MRDLPNLIYHRRRDNCYLAPFLAHTGAITSLVKCVGVVYRVILAAVAKHTVNASFI